MDEMMSLLIDLHVSGERQGPGSEFETLRAVRLAGLDSSAPLAVADVGCGTGASTLTLARELNAQVTAVDFLPEFLEELNRRASDEGLGDRITTLACSMDALPFSEGQLDVIWSEGAIYNMGFAQGVADWRRFLKPDGVLVVSEITWTTAQRPREVQQFWDSAYPEIDTASAKLALLEQAGYSPLAYFVLPPSCWLDNYYEPIRARNPGFLERHGHSDAARALVEEGEEETRLYEKYQAYYSYGMYIAKLR